MGLEQYTYLNAHFIYGCKACNTHMSTHDAIVSENFRGQHGVAYLFSSVSNIKAGHPEERDMTTGRHIVRDLRCRHCRKIVGWKYDLAYEEKEKYKTGKYILEMELMHQVQ